MSAMPLFTFAVDDAISPLSRRLMRFSFAADYAITPDA